MIDILLLNMMLLLLVINALDSFLKLAEGLTVLLSIRLLTLMYKQLNKEWFTLMKLTKSVKR